MFNCNVLIILILMLIPCIESPIFLFNTCETKFEIDSPDVICSDTSLSL